MYTKIAEEEDNKMTDRWQKDADGILIFVSFLITVRVAFANNLEHYRQVYSLPPLLRYLR